MEELAIEDTPKKSSWPIYLNIPNIIGYARIVANGAAFGVAFANKELFAILYFARPGPVSGKRELKHIGRFDVFEDDTDMESPGNQGLSRSEDPARKDREDQRELRKSFNDRDRREEHREHRRHEERDHDEARKCVSNSLVAERNRAQEDDQERLLTFFCTCLPREEHRKPLRGYYTCHPQWNSLRDFISSLHLATSTSRISTCSFCALLCLVHPFTIGVYGFTWTS